MNASNAKVRMAFLGAGNMASALAKGFCESGRVREDAMTFRDVIGEKAVELARSVGGRAASSVADALKDSDAVVLAVKPQNAAELLAEIASAVHADPVFISIMAGIPCARLERGIGGSPRVVRVMPNTPALVAAGASGVAPGSHATRADMELSLALFGAVGVAVEVAESLMDAVTAVSGSGPAYFFRMIEALTEAGVAVGLERDIAGQLALQTAFGAAKLALETGEDPARLREKVTSKGGTTAAGLEALREAGFEEAVKHCVQAASVRSAELGREQT